MASQKTTREVPAWAMPTVIVAGVLLLGFVMWRALYGPSAATPGQVVKVHPNMYSLKDELAKGTVGQRGAAAVNRNGQ